MRLDSSKRAGDLAAPVNARFITRGQVRGDCSHQHRTLTGAARCLRRDQRGCGQQGGYSDRAIYYADGTELNQADFDYMLDELDSLPRA